MTEMPELVREAVALAQRMGFEQSCLPETGRLLAVLAGAQQRGPIGEIGTGCGVGAAWIAGALRPELRFVTIELNTERAAAARDLFAGRPNVEVLAGDWREILPHGPFTLLFADGGQAKQHEPETLLDAVAPGGMVVLDDLTPVEHWPEEWRGQRDPVREFWLSTPRARAVELVVTAPSVVPGMAVILATRVA